MLRRVILPSIVGLSVLLGGTSAAVAAIPNNFIAMYNQAAMGDTDKTEPVNQALSELVAREGATALNLVYLGSSETLLGRDAFLPWNKMKHVEKGIAQIDKGLSLLKSNQNEEELVMGLPYSYLAQANAAVVFTTLPSMFNQFDKGYELYLELLSQKDFQTYSPDATAWIYEYAIQAAKNADDTSNAKLWSAQLQSMKTVE
ncbi:hypothetical protein [Vibrio sp. HN007]|uniref:hypothetical protein n=1 Tax=Vibrio iocasae TaxID=3098914 RepID=UPI0035D455D2